MPYASRNRHNLSHYRLLTHDMGQLVPVGVQEVLPGDKFNHRSRAMLRVQPLLKPVMHPVEVRIHHWFVPNRIIWSDWEDFITRADSDLTIPTITLTNQARGSLADHLGIPCDGTTDYELNALPFYAYNAIYNHAYRDQNLISEVAQDDLNLKYIAWQKDYFTTARTEPQFGDAAIDIPFATGSKAPVKGIGTENQTWNDTSGSVYETGETASTDFGSDAFIIGTTSGTRVYIDQDPDNAGFPGIFADLSAAAGAGINVNDMRSAIAQQKFLEHRNRFGGRYEDYLRFMGVRPRDGRLSDPEYLGGGKNVISFSEVLSTADSGALGVGDLAGHGITGVTTRPYRRYFEEHGYVISLMSVRPRAIYSQVLHRHWLRSTVFDFWHKELEAQGPQEVFTKELYALNANSTDILGYQGRHDEYRAIQSYVSGEYRDGGSEEDWHFARDFASAPALNQSFIDCVPTDRVYADTATPELYSMVTHSIRAVRPVSERAQH